MPKTIRCRVMLFLLAMLPCLCSAAAPIRFLLTFDDGPSGSIYLNSTEQILDVLDHNPIQPGIKAIFFTQTRARTGGATDIGQALLRRERDDGHLLAFHTATAHHDNHRRMEPAVFEQSLQDGIADLTVLTGSAPQLVRPPFWNYDERTLASYHRHGLQMLLTDLSANDGKIWGVNFSLTKRRNLLRQLTALREQWSANALPVVAGSTPVVVTFHDVNTYTARTMEVYLQLLLDVAQELDMPTAGKAFYDDRSELEQAALARTVHDSDVSPRLPGLWNWLWK